MPGLLVHRRKKAAEGDLCFGKATQRKKRTTEAEVHRASLFAYR